MSPPIKKRKRTVSQASQQHTPEIAPPTRSEDIYLDDGNIVLVAQDVAFRVHRSQLARHSEVFCDMLALAEQPTDAEAFDGCPVVRLSDMCKDVSELLRVLYDHIKFDAQKLDQLTSVLRLSTKYLIDHLRTSALEALAEAYPKDLSQYDGYKQSRIQCGDVIELAHEVQADVLLPVAYYELCGYPAEKTLSFGLTQPMLETLFLGKNRISTKLLRFVKSDIIDRRMSDECTRRSNCRSAWNNLGVEACELLREPSSITEPDPLSEIACFINWDCVSYACMPCRAEFENDIDIEREALWSSLPEIFNLGSWEELNKS